MSDLEIIQKALVVLEKHWEPELGMRLEFYADRSFSIGYSKRRTQEEIDKNPQLGYVKDISFYQAQGVGELIEYCKSAIENPELAYVDR